MIQPRALTSALVTLCASVLLAAPAQQAGNSQPPSAAQTADQKAATFTAHTELVLVPTIVTDRSGAHIHGLTKDDFVLQENGAEQKITTFEEFQDSSTPMQHLAPQNGIYSNIATDAVSESPRRITILVMDMVNTRFTDQAYARQQLVKYLSKSVDRNELLTLISLTRGGVHVIHDFTTDTSVLLAALKKARGQVGAMEGEDMEAVYSVGDTAFSANTAAVDSEASDIMDMMEARAAAFQQAVATYSTLDALRDIAQAYAGVPGRKSLVWLTGSFPFPFPKPGDNTPGPNAQEIEHIFDLLSDANIAVYPVDARGLETLQPSAADNVRISRTNPGGAQMARMAAHNQSLDTLRNVAEVTGGRAFYNTNDLANAVKKASQDSESFYMLGYYRNANDQKGGWRKLSVKVHRGGVEVRARDGFFVTKGRQDAAQLRRHEMQTAMISPFNLTGLALRARFVPVPKDPSGKSTDTPEGKRRIGFQLILAPSAIQPDTSDDNFVSFDFAAVAHDPTLQVVDQANDSVTAHLKPESVTKLTTHGLDYNNILELKPGEYTVRFVVRDNVSGRMGTLNAPLTVQ